MAGQGNLFSRDYSTDDSLESSLFPNPIPEEKGKENLYSLWGKSGIVGDPHILFTYALVCLLRSLTTWLSTKNKCSLLSSVFGSRNKLLSKLSLVE